MGCYCTHKFLDLEDQEEVLMMKCERSLGLSDFSSAKLSAHIESLTATGPLDQDALQQFWKRFSVEATLSTGKKTPVGNFYTLLLSTSTRSLSLLVTLLGGGSNYSKTEQLFNLYQQEGRLSVEAVEAMTRDLCSLSLVALPQFAVEYLESEKHLDASVLIQNYAVKLEEARPYAERLVKMLILDPEAKSLDLAAFRDKTAAPEKLFLFSTKALRREALETYKKIVKQYSRKKNRGERLNTI